jgi:exopolysaccharide biosynthesis polyprenyl glycosylphosphotransferase
MIRLGPHYVEPRRIAFFVLEQTALWLAYVLAAAATARGLGIQPALEPLLARAVFAALAIEAALHLGDLHQLAAAVADAPSGRRLLRALGVATIACGAARLGRTSVALAPAEVAGLGAAVLVALGSRALLPSLVPRLGLRTRVLLVGTGASARVLEREAARDGGVEIVGSATPRAVDLVERARAVHAHTLVVAVDDRRGLPVRELLRCRIEGVEVIDGAAFAARALHRLPVELVRPSDLVFEDGFVHPPWLRAARRALSLVATLALGVVAAPLVAAAALAVRLDSRGAVLYRQERVGRRGAPFSLLKLRTMREGAEREGAAWAAREDPRITRVGRLLRRFRVDELPQLWNVLVGDMELVGPRPERPPFVAELRSKIPYYDLRHVVRPGITGWAQISYPYAASIEEAREKLQYDLYYVRHLSLSLDLLILARTAKVVLLGRGAR